MSGFLRFGCICKSLIVIIFLFDKTEAQPHAQRCSRSEYLQHFPCAYGEGKHFINFRAAGKCLEFNHRERVTWRVAYDRCHERGARLIRMLDAREVLTLRNTAWRHNYWIGLNDIAEEGHFSWDLVEGGDQSPDAEPFMLNSTIARWRPGQPGEPDPSRNCVIMDVNDRWMDVPCDARRGYICERTSGLKPPPSRIGIEFHLKPNTLVQGRRFYTSCTGFVGLGGSFDWVAPDLRITAGMIAPRPGSRRDLLMRDSFGRCGRFLDQSISLLALSSLDSHRVQCCTRNRDEDFMRSCSQTRLVRVIMDSSPPALSMTFHESPARAYTNHPIQGTCSAAVGIPGVLFLRIQGDAVDARYVITNRSRVYLDKPLYGVRILPVPVTDTTENGAVIRAIFRICVRGSLQGAVISCATQDLITWKPIYTVKSQPIEKVYLPLPPYLDIGYHALPNKFDLGEELKATCVAFVGDYGELIWTLKTPELEQSWQINYVDAASFTLDNAFNWTGLQISHDETFSETDGPVITSTFSLLVTEALTGATLTCRSHPPVAEFPVTNFDSDDMVKKSSLFLAMNLPRTPVMKVDQFLISNTPMDRWMVTGSCDAIVGDNGSLSWLLRTVTWARIWAVDLGGNVSVTTLLNLNGIRGKANPFKTAQFKLVDAKNGQDVKPSLKTTLTVEMRWSAEWVSVACYSRDLTRCRVFLPDEDKLSASLHFERPKMEPKIFDIRLPIFVAIAFFSPLCVFLVGLLMKKMVAVTSDAESEGEASSKHHSHEHANFLHILYHPLEHENIKHHLHKHYHKHENSSVHDTVAGSEFSKALSEKSQASS